MFLGKDIADGANADLSSGSTAVATVAIVTAVTAAGKKPAGNSAVQPISVTDELLKQDWIKETVSEPIVFAWQNVPLWIKVPPEALPHAKSSLRFIHDRLPLLKAANRNIKPE